VLNRVSGDYYETLMYGVLAAVDGRATVEGVASTLGAPAQDVRV
jgi:hypothetical protein